ncbi:MAG: amidohydrolase [Bacteroidales bacterium]|nr:amidohydrolase [Bacteroidales bacterium]MCF8343311.1 amidohydrolase [Bacteroidales bacterium]MCF8376416.1 amidohydrolase [Bacteroidales bacterium]
MYYNAHIHTFTERDVPNRFLPLALVQILKTKVGFWIVSKFLRHAIPFTDNDMLDRYLTFVELGKLGSQENIFNECERFYPDRTKFIVLPMDMACMGAGKVDRPYADQIDELAELAKKDSRVIPFFHVDPRRPGVYEMFREGVEQKGIRGVKLYPPLGYFPYDEGLDEVYAYCQENDIPVLAHCSPYNPVRFKGSKKELLDLLAKSKEPVKTKGKKRKELCSHFTNPLNYKYVIEKFPKLRVCFAHFGSAYYWEKFIEDPDNEHNWFSIIRRMIAEHDNFYTDISFTLNDRNFFSLLKVILTDPKVRAKVLFGSDYYMVETECNERRFGLDLRAYLGEDIFNDIAVENPKRFLG